MVQRGPDTVLPEEIQDAIISISICICISTYILIIIIAANTASIIIIQDASSLDVASRGGLAPSIGNGFASTGEASHDADHAHIQPSGGAACLGVARAIRKYDIL